MVLLLLCPFGSALEISLPAVTLLSDWEMFLPWNRMSSSLLFAVERFCTPPELKLHVFSSSKHGKEKQSMSEFFLLEFKTLSCSKCLGVGWPRWLVTSVTYWTPKNENKAFWRIEGYSVRFETISSVCIFMTSLNKYFRWSRRWKKWKWQWNRRSKVYTRRAPVSDWRAAFRRGR